MKLIESDRLYFKALDESYLQELFKLHSNIEVMKYIRKPDETFEDTKKTIKKQMDLRSENHLLGIYCAHLKENSTFIGWGYLNHLDFIKSEPVELGYRLFPHFWKMGFATEIGKSLSDHFFKHSLEEKLCAVTKKII